MGLIFLHAVVVVGACRAYREWSSFEEALIYSCSCRCRWVDRWAWLRMLALRQVSRVSLKAKDSLLERNPTNCRRFNCSKKKHWLFIDSKPIYQAHLVKTRLYYWHGLNSHAPLHSTSAGQHITEHCPVFGSMKGSPQTSSQPWLAAAAGVDWTPAKTRQINIIDNKNRRLITLLCLVEE